MVLFYNLMGPPLYMRSVVDRKVVKRHMTIHDHSTENNYISIQFLYFTSRNTQYTQRHDSTNFLHRGKDDDVYTILNTQSRTVHLLNSINHCDFCKMKFIIAVRHGRCFCSPAGVNKHSDVTAERISLLL